LKFAFAVNRSVQAKSDFIFGLSRRKNPHLKSRVRSIFIGGTFVRESVRLLHAQAVQKITNIRKNRVHLIQILQDLDSLEGHLDFECPSLWQYCLKHLDLDDHETGTLINVARKAVEIPELKAAIEQGKIQLSKARRIVPVLNKENQAEWLSKAQSLTKKALEREVAAASPKHATVESAKYVSRERIQFQCGLDHEVHHKFLRVQDLVSQSHRNHADREETLKELIRFYLEHKDPLLKAERAQKRKFKKSFGLGQVENAQSRKPKPEVCAAQVKSVCPYPRESKPQLGPGQTNRPRQYPASLKHELNLRDQTQCTHVDSTGTRCQERRWLSFHHKIEISRGGRDSLENLTTLCFAHHKLIHQNNRLSDQERIYVY
jgi:hypothetical protein